MNRALRGILATGLAVAAATVMGCFADVESTAEGEDIAVAEQELSGQCLNCGNGYYCDGNTLMYGYAVKVNGYWKCAWFGVQYCSNGCEVNPCFESDRCI